MRLEHDVAWNKQSITHAEELMSFYQRISRVIFKICISKSYLPSWATKHTYFGNFTCPQTHFGHSKPSDEC